jgi:hypothetical protein
VSHRLFWFVIFALGWSVSPSIAQDFPEGPGRNLVVSNCGRCHGLDRVSAGHSVEGWQGIVYKMQGLGMGLPQDQVSTVIGYLAQNFPEKDRVEPGQGIQSNNPINLPRVCDQRGVCCLGEREGCFGSDVLRRMTPQ